MEENKKESEEIKKKLKAGLNLLSQKKVQWTIVLVLLLLVIILGSSIRIGNINLLVDETTGKNIPLALDPYYFLRISETMLQGGLPEFDSFRQPMNIEFSKEILPACIVGIYRIVETFNPETTIQQINIISPVIFFILGIIIFFFLTYILTNSKKTALVSSVILSVIPSYLYRTMAGFSDHESIGMFAFFITLLVFAFLLKKFKNKTKMMPYAFGGVVLGLSSAFTIACWGGIANFIYMIIPLSILIVWLTKFRETEDEKNKQQKNYLVFYIFWIISNILLMPIFGFSFSSAIVKMVGSSGLLSLFVFGFVLIDYLSLKYLKKIKFVEKHKILFDLVVLGLIGIIFLSIMKGNIFNYLQEIFSRLLHPFGEGRVGLTVAENSQPYLSDWINSIGKSFFWIFYIGMLFVGFDISKGISSKKNKTIFSLSWIILISGLLFSRYSPSSLFNGTNFLSQVIYFGSVVFFIVVVANIYKKEKIKINPLMTIIVSWLIFMLISGRGAIRLFFVVTPFICFMVGYLVNSLWNYCKQTKEDTLKKGLCLALIIISVIIFIGVLNFYKSSSVQAQYTGPSANQQWQQAMSWVRNNTSDEAIFIHWWDYGYWVQYLGERATIADGGHFQGDFRDHLIGRYFLTNSNPELALSFMKSNDVSYILIDPSDIGKYTAYSKIGSDEKGEDRYSWIYPLVIDSSQTQETRDGKIQIYYGNIPLDEDIIYEKNGTEIFIPAGKAGLGAVTLEIQEKENQTKISQPQGIFIYNNQQYSLPIRYVENNGELIDFGEGINAGIKIIPLVTQSQEGLSINNLGTIVYISPKVFPTFFTQMYLFDDISNQYPTINIAHKEQNSAVEYLKSQGIQIGDFIYYGGEILGPIKIWEVNYPEDILVKEEFLRTSGEYAEFDDLEVK